jgi:murein DD-endopeptidase MepM/ murein hydrolase activator NlpD
MSAAGLIGAEDLYAGLMAAAKGLDEAGAEAFLPKVLDALRDTPEAARLRAVDQGLLQAVIRAGAGLHPTRNGTAVERWLAGSHPAPMFDPDLGGARRMILKDGMAGMPAYSDRAFDAWFAGQKVAYGLGPYAEDRAVYRTAQFADAASPMRRTVHLGIDVFALTGTAVHAPLPGVVEHVTYNADPLDYGHTLILRHDAGGVPFWTLYGHLGASLPALCGRGQKVAAGQLVAHLGDWHENGGWSAHLHFQVMTDMLAQRGGNFFGVGHAGIWPVWQAICPDPSRLMGLPEGIFRE